MRRHCRPSSRSTGVACPVGLAEKAPGALFASGSRMPPWPPRKVVRPFGLVLGRALDPDVPAVSLDDLLGDRQAEPPARRALIADPVGVEEGVENLLPSPGKRPSPWSYTSKSRCVGSPLTRTRISLPCGPNLMALSMSLESACRSLRWSPNPCSSVSTFTSRWMRRDLALSRSPSSTALSSACRSNGSRCTACPPPSNVAKLTRLSIVRARRSVASPIDSWMRLYRSWRGRTRRSPAGSSRAGAGPIAQR